MSLHIRVSGRRLVSSILATSALGLSVALLGPPGVAQAAETGSSSLTNFATESASVLLDGSSRTCHRSSIQVETTASYVLTQGWLDSIAYTNPSAEVPAGRYTLNDCVTPFEGAGLHQSWLDPAPDPDDPTSGVAISMQYSAGITRPTRWGSMLIPTS